MFDEDLRASVLKTLKLEEAEEEEQNVALLSIESTAYKRLARAIPELLTEEQLHHVEAMKSEGKSDEEIVEWVEGRLPEYEELVRDAILDVADEVAV